MGPVRRRGAAAPVTDIRAAPVGDAARQLSHARRIWHAPPIPRIRGPAAGPEPGRGGPAVQRDLTPADADAEPARTTCDRVPSIRRRSLPRPRRIAGRRRAAAARARARGPLPAGAAPPPRPVRHALRRPTPRPRRPAVRTDADAVSGPASARKADPLRPRRPPTRGGSAPTRRASQGGAELEPHRADSAGRAAGRPGLVATRDSAPAPMDLFEPGAPNAAGTVRRRLRAPGATGPPPGRAPAVLPGYDSMTLAQVRGHLRELTAAGRRPRCWRGSRPARTVHRSSPC